jgi:hypothetical protein
MGQDQRQLDEAERAVREGGFEALEPANDSSEWELFEAIIGREEEQFNERIDALLAAADSPGEGLTRLIEKCVVEYDWTLWIELWSLALREESARELRKQLDRSFRERIARVVEAGRASGEFDVDDPEGATLAIATVIDTLAVDATLGDTTVSPNYMFRATVVAAGRMLGAELKLPERPSDG